MKSLYFLILVVAVQAYVTRVERELKHVPTPLLTQLTTIDPSGFILKWTPVKSLDSSDPIIGYKVKLWEYGTTIVYHYETIDGVLQLVEEQHVQDKVPSTVEDKIPESKPTEYLVSGAENTSLQLENLKQGVTFEMRVQAYTKSGEGALSKPMRVHLGPKE